MILKLDNKITDEGGYSVIIKEGNKVYKLFKNSICEKKQRKFEDKLRESVFDSEVNAYRITQKVSELKQFVPEFFGTVVVDKVINNNNDDSSDLFLLNCCYTMEYINGKFQKLNFHRSNCEVKKVLEIFDSNGINYYFDASISFLGDPSKFKIIDFATYDAYYLNELKYLNKSNDQL